MSNLEIVQSFIRAWGERDVEKILDLMTPTAVWKNTGLPDAVGRDAIRQVVGSFLGSATSVTFQVHHIAETAAGSVLTERTDVFETPGGRISVPVMGVFELEKGQISSWRDYFDPRPFVQ